MSLLEVLARVPSSCRAYVAACWRHLGEWLEGQDVDAEAAGTLIDDRNYTGGYSALVERLTPHVARLQALYAGREAPHHWTILDTIVPGSGDG